MKTALPWSLVTPVENPEQTLVQISSQLVLEGTFAFRVIQGKVECMGYTVQGGTEQQEERKDPGKKAGAKHIQPGEPSRWIQVVSGDAQHRFGASLIFPLTNVSGKAK